ncbi:hypothetical protein ACFFUS_17585 [Vibrio gallaecicus]|uniref:hypothetical protein n=1 Tax=Vibrio gallaecicus TaxID=552386 RepID=UPI0010CA174F|nr:hypothetical protein [Vibrio gallaecicus]MDN3614779.1 hypothetical protein [Vibrio gallaecicus]
MNIFLTTSPLQLICAIEAKSAYKTKNNILIIRDEKTESGKKQIKNLLVDNQWDHIIKLGRKNKIWNTSKVIWRLKKINPSLSFDNFFLADYFAWRSNVILANIKTENEIIIDDGTNTIQTYNYLSVKSNKTHRNKPSLDRMLSLLNIKKPREISYKDNLSAFTMFNLKESTIKVQKNTFNQLQIKLKTSDSYDKDGKVGFIGQGLVNARGINLTSYLEILNSILNKHPQGIIYFPHRSETQEVSDAIKELDNIDFHNSKSPLEFEISEQKIKLSAIYGITSAASFTISKIYKELPVYDIQVPVSEYGMEELGKTINYLHKEIGLPIADL